MVAAKFYYESVTPILLLGIPISEGKHQKRLLGYIVLKFGNDD